MLKTENELTIPADPAVTNIDWLPLATSLWPSSEHVCASAPSPHRSTSDRPATGGGRQPGRPALEIDTVLGAFTQQGEGAAWWCT